jgi:hypothetical protein
MERYLYLIAGLIWLAIDLIIAVRRPDLRRFMVIVGILGGIIGVVSEYWYFQDYWRPASLFGTGVYSIEDFLFGFGITAFGAVFPYVALKTKRAPRQKGALARLIAIFVYAILLNIVMVDLLHINSILVTYVLFITLIVAGLLANPAAWKKAVLTMLAGLVISTIIYFVLFGLIDPTYIQRHFLLSGNPYAPTLGGFLPVTEILWYALWGAAIAVVHDIVNPRPTFQETA